MVLCISSGRTVYPLVNYLSKENSWLYMLGRIYFMVEQKTYERYAIFQTGGKQYQAVEGKTISIEKINKEAGAPLEFPQVLFRKTAEGAFEVGTPYLQTPIKASVVKQMRDRKVIIFKFKRRKKSRVKGGHRQPKTIIRIESI